MSQIQLNERALPYMVDESVTIAGYGSLTSKESALKTNPSLTGFRWGTVQGYARVFNLVSIVNIRRGRANVETGEIATCTAQKRVGHKLLVRLAPGLMYC